MAGSVLTGWLRYITATLFTNIVYDPSESDCKYILVDFEHGGKPGKVPGDSLTSLGDKYTTRSDIYQFGKLLEEYLFSVAFSRRKNFATKLKEKTSSANQALRLTWLNDA
ncbi:8086_t:CDS:1 [Ambispora gerdemannii]|uniref:8086_t:CDS:1 n=1 Tax=Ambispora gerdemannii TaxID=144530 RepID=A0A9N8ZYV0_9GLOM|nr:8086_t:CDS:1 [Ambispora gerdemannii]